VLFFFSPFSPQKTLPKNIMGFIFHIFFFFFSNIYRQNKNKHTYTVYICFEKEKKNSMRGTKLLMISKYIVYVFEFRFGFKSTNDKWGVGREVVVLVVGRGGGNKEGCSINFFFI
jgi:hypothetical protein